MENRQNYLKALSQLNEMELADNIKKWEEIAADDKNGLEARIAAYQNAADTMIALSKMQKEDETREIQTKLDQIESIEAKSYKKRSKADKDLMLQKTSLTEQLAVINKKYGIQDENTQLQAAKNISKAVEAEGNRLHELNKSVMEANGDDLGVKLESEIQKWDALSLSLSQNGKATEQTTKYIANAKEAALELIELSYKYGKQSTQLSISQADQMEDLNKKYLTGKITVEEYGKAQKDLQKVFQIDTLDSQIKNVTSQIEILRNSMDGLDENQTSGIKDKIAELQKQLAELANKRYEIDVTARTDDAKKALQGIQKTFESIKQYTNDATTAISDIASVGYQNQVTAVEELETAQQKRYEKEVANINNSTISETDKANKLKVLEAERQAQSEANDRKKKKAEAEQAKFEKALNIANTIANTAAAVTKALPNIPLAIAVGVMGAAQLYKIIATKIPEYAEGTDNHPGGPAIVGEGKKKELVQMPDGSSFVAEKPTLINLPRSTKVIPLENELLSRQASNATAIIANGTIRNTAYAEQREIAQQWEIAKWQSRQNAKIFAKGNKKIVNNIKTNIDFGWTRYVNRNIYGKN